MNRLDFQELSSMRLREAKALLASGFPEGAYYLAGYAVECALKACIAKRTQEHDFPDRDAYKYYKHDLQELLVHAKLKEAFELAMQAETPLEDNWNIAKNWSEEARYEQGRTIQQAQSLIDAIDKGKGGILPWLQQRW
jgi:HEPN domain-containing protein